MLKVTRWRPDTCECELEYQWDDTESEDIRTHTIANVVKACSAHALVVDKTQHYSKVLDENQRKNIVLGEILEKVPSAVEEVEQEDGTIVKKLRRGKEYKWSFDENRNLIVDLVGFTSQEKLAVKGLTDVRFPNKVKQA